jgi:hypothetical protein
MLYVNDDNDDELFRKAATDYPLRTDSPDWETVSDKITDTTALNNNTANKEKRTYRFWSFNWLTQISHMISGFVRRSFKPKS